MANKLEYLLTFSNSNLENSNSLLIYQDYGFGDMVQYLRYIPFLLSKISTVGLLIKGNFYEPWVNPTDDPPSFKSLIVHNYTNPRLEIFIDGWNNIPKYYSHKIEFMSLESLTERVPEPQIWKSYNKKYLSKDKLNVGYCLQGSPGHPNDSNRSIDPLYFSSILHEFSDRVRFINLSQVNLQKQFNITKIEDTVALLQELDLLVSVDTLLVHLAGYSNIPVMLLHGKNSDKRWRKNWYPNITSFWLGEKDEWQRLINYRFKQYFSDWTNSKTSLR